MTVKSVRGRRRYVAFVCDPSLDRPSLVAALRAVAGDGAPKVIQCSEGWCILRCSPETRDEAVAAMSAEEYQVLDEQYANVLLDQLEALIPQLTYGQDQVIMLQMKESDGYYSLVDSGMQKLDEVMIDYYGSYA